MTARAKYDRSHVDQVFQWEGLVVGTQQGSRCCQRKDKVQASKFMEFCRNNSGSVWKFLSYSFHLTIICEERGKYEIVLREMESKLSVDR